VPFIGSYRTDPGVLRTIESAANGDKGERKVAHFRLLRLAGIANHETVAEGTNDLTCRFLERMITPPFAFAPFPVHK